MPENERPGLDIVLPCFNPGENWAENIIEVMSGISEQLSGVPLSLIVVNDGSSRGYSANGIEKIRQRLPGVKVIGEENPVNKGKGNALRRGMKAATAEYQIYTDVDFPYTTASLISIYENLVQGSGDIVAGVRDEEYYKGVPTQRKTLSKFVRWLLRTFLRLQITDTQCGLKGFNAKGKAIFLQTSIDRFLFDMEFIFLASNDPQVKLFPAKVQLKPNVIFSKMSWKILFHEGMNFLGIFLRFLFSPRKK
ncbi:MAG: glycosyltransferase family 2 protein [Bacteroidia bacterium]|nr:glycosyltransferase family 2 protein [Bacteroidia bacterium]